MSPGLSHPTCGAAYTRFTPSNSEQRSHPLSYRGCWHRVSRCLLKRYRHRNGYWPSLILPSPQGFTTRRPSSPTRRRCVRLSPIAQNSPLLPPVGVWTVSQFSVADHPLRPATRLCLGRPLPYQLADGPQAHPQARAFMKRPALTPSPVENVVLCCISPPFGELSTTQG